MDNEYAIMNLEVMAHNIAVYASYFNRKNDVFGHIDNQVERAEKELLNLVETMKHINNIK